jgi:pyridoxal phosphate enzyme (YggS family)
MSKAELRANLEQVQARIAAAAQAVGRAADSVRLVVVTKGHPAEAIQELYELGVRDIGESYVQEAEAKQVAAHGLAELKWHMIGHVQSRKADLVAGRFDVVHSVDSLKLAERLDRTAGEAGKKLPILLECNVSGEFSKHGWAAQDPLRRVTLMETLEPVLALPNLQVQGLMSIAPIVQHAGQARPYFGETRKFRDQLARRFPQTEWGELSMGMSDDFEVAIQEGATMVRVGTAILGMRSYTK